MNLRQNEVFLQSNKIYYVNDDVDIVLLFYYYILINENILGIINFLEKTICNSIFMRHMHLINLIFKAQ